MKVVLASNSPRRRELLALGGWPFQVLSAPVDERVLPGESPAGYVQRLADQKGRAAMKAHAGSIPAEALVIACDTAVVDGKTILGKPVGAAEAEVMLRRLRGHSHLVYTALAIFRPMDGVALQDLCVTEVPMRFYSDEEILAYVASGDAYDKAGAYAIQHRGFHPVESLAGCFANVMGLPLCHLVRLLKKLGAQLQNDLAQACQQAHAYACPIYQQVLDGKL